MSTPLIPGLSSLSNPNIPVLDLRRSHVEGPSPSVIRPTREACVRLNCLFSG